LLFVGLLRPLFLSCGHSAKTPSRFLFFFSFLAAGRTYIGDHFFHLANIAPFFLPPCGVSSGTRIFFYLFHHGTYTWSGPFGPGVRCVAARLLFPPLKGGDEITDGRTKGLASPLFFFFPFLPCGQRRRFSFLFFPQKRPEEGAGGIDFFPLFFWETVFPLLFFFFPRKLTKKRPRPYQAFLGSVFFSPPPSCLRDRLEKEGRLWVPVGPSFFFRCCWQLFLISYPIEEGGRMGDVFSPFYPLFFSCPDSKTLGLFFFFLFFFFFFFFFFFLSSPPRCRMKKGGVAARFFTPGP